MWLMTLEDNLCISSIATKHPPQLVLGIGTGTGAWAIEYAKRNPSSRVIGTDLSAIQPAGTPSKCEFKIENTEVDWTFSEPFDFINSRLLCLGIRDWPHYFRQSNLGVGSKNRRYRCLQCPPMAPPDQILHSSSG